LLGTDCEVVEIGTFQPLIGAEDRTGRSALGLMAVLTDSDLVSKVIKDDVLSERRLECRDQCQKANGPRHSQAGR
jgi:hypothetical protein